MKETIQVKVGEKVAEITLVTPGAVFDLGTELMPAPGGPVLPPIIWPKPDIGPKPICPPMCPPACPPSHQIIICDPTFGPPKPPMPKPS